MTDYMTKNIDTENYPINNKINLRDMILLQTKEELIDNELQKHSRYEQLWEKIPELAKFKGEGFYLELFNYFFFISYSKDGFIFKIPKKKINDDEYTFQTHEFVSLLEKEKDISFSKCSRTTIYSVLKEIDKKFQHANSKFEFSQETFDLALMKRGLPNLQSLVTIYEKYLLNTEIFVTQCQKATTSSPIIKIFTLGEDYVYLGFGEFFSRKKSIISEITTELSEILKNLNEKWQLNLSMSLDATDTTIQISTCPIANFWRKIPKIFAKYFVLSVGWWKITLLGEKLHYWGKGTLTEKVAPK